jgi:hypothetical protein
VSGLFFSDLDGTLVYSKARTPDLRRARIVEATDSGHMGYVHADSWPLLRKMADAGTVIPSTTRTVAEFNRLKLPAAQTAIVANGGTVLVAGVPDPEWQSLVRGSLDASSLTHLRNRLEAMVSGAGAQAVSVRDGMFLTVTTRRGRTAPDGFDDDVRALTEADGYVVSRQHRKLYLTPTSLTKEAAAAYLADRVGADLTLAAGDSTLDAGLLAWADAAMHPRHAVDTLPGAPTAATGIDAGLELLTWAHSRIHGPAGTADVA